jgi:hypothetical protein
MEYSHNETLATQKSTGPTRQTVARKNQSEPLLDRSCSGLFRSGLFRRGLYLSQKKTKLLPRRWEGKWISLFYCTSAK